MPQPRPKILTRFTVPTGGWTVEIDISDGVQFNDTVQATVLAGNYYMSWDNQSDDFLKVFSQAVEDAVDGVLSLGTVVYCYINDDHKVLIQFDNLTGNPERDIRFDWPNGTEIAAVLGFDSSATDESTGSDNPLFTGDYHHSFGWYADEDGYILEDMVEDVDNPQVAQSRAISGHVTTQYHGSVFTNMLNLQFLTRAKTFSNEKDYQDAPVYPYERNEGLECWFREAREGTPFRVYRYNQVDTSIAEDTGTTTSASSTVMTGTGKSWDVEPFRWPGAQLYLPEFGNATGAPCKWYIESSTATTVTVNAASSSENFNDYQSPNTFYIFDHKYETYWLNLEDMTAFEPQEIPKIDRYNINIPLYKYVA